MSGNQKSTAAHSGRGKLKRAPAVIPIFVIPGILGSRLGQGGRLIWNPAGAGAFTFRSLLAGLQFDDPGPLTCVTSILRDMNQVLVPEDRFGRYPKGHKFHELGEKVPGFYGAVVSFYGELVRELVEELPKDLGGRWIPKVCVFGYDWRQPNDKTAALLEQRVTSFRAKLKAQGFRVKNNILLAHSMGGLVSRHS